MKLMERMKQKRMGNKGFSLVELIIVIAIMAILVGIVGTQVVPYIENSRKARDIQVFSGLVTDAMSAYSSQAANLDPTATYRITVDVTTGQGTVAITSAGGGTTGVAQLQTAFNELRTAGDLGLVSRAANSISTVAIDCQNTAPMISLNPDGIDDDDEANQFDTITAN